jgi:hypothetical protein
MAAVISIIVGLLVIIAVVVVAGIALIALLHVFGLIFLEAGIRTTAGIPGKLLNNPLIGCFAILVVLVIAGWLVWYGIESLWDQAKGLVK